MLFGCGMGYGVTCTVIRVTDSGEAGDGGKYTECVVIDSGV